MCEGEAEWTVYWTLGSEVINYNYTSFVGAVGGQGGMNYALTIFIMWRLADAVIQDDLCKVNARKECRETV